MPYLSQFEVLATPIFPPVEPEAVPFVIQGYFVLISRLQDSHAGDLQVELNFFATPSFPAATGGALADLFLVDYQNESGTTSLATTFTGDKLVVPIGSGKTVLAGIQPNAASPALYAAAGAVAPNAPPIAARGYVTIDIAKSLPGGPLRQNSCRPDRIHQLGAMMEGRRGSIRTRIQGQSGGEVATAGECIAGYSGAGDRGECCHA